MNKVQLHRQLQLLHKDLTKVELRMEKISDKLGIDRGHEWLERTLWEVEELIKVFDEPCPECDTQYKDEQ